MNVSASTIIILVFSFFAARHAAGGAMPTNLLSGGAPRQAEGAAPMNNTRGNIGASGDEIPLGDWGGEHISLQLTAQGGTVEFDCAHGTITRKLVSDRSGRFDVPGTYVEEHGGPVRADERAEELPVRYTGSIKNGKLRLTITRSDTKKSLGTFTLTHGQEAFLVKCR
jgi:hypothetical protein